MTTDTRPTVTFTKTNGWWFATINGTGTELDNGRPHWTGHTDDTTRDELKDALGPILEDATVDFVE